ncbi:MAG: hypothetical protein PHU46_05385 [Rhodocyclaceae bacterium]|nr:hypothetical protein [Rhodocyclaceae bacterium]
MNRDQYLAKRMWLCGTATEAVVSAKNLPALLVSEGHSRAAQMAEKSPPTVRNVAEIGGTSASDDFLAAPI